MVEDINSTENPTSCRRLDFDEGAIESNKKKEDDVVDFQNNGDHLLNTKSGIPEIGMKFDSEKAAFQFYNEYARVTGFSIRRSTLHKDSCGNIMDRKFCCSSEGQRPKDKRDVYSKSHHPETRYNCRANMKINARYSSKYEVVEFIAEHNGHTLVSPNKVHMLRSQRKITTQQSIEIENLDKSGIPPKAGLTYMSQQVGGRGKIRFTLVDLKNYLRSKRTIPMREGDAGGLLNYLQTKKSQDPNFYDAVQVDEDDLITNIFWADGQMIVDYVHFGDVVCFDTTYKKNKDGRPFALFVGVNHHKQTTIFGAALLYDETAETFMWLFNTFAEAMNEKLPETILTDQDAAMALALKKKWPNTYHRLCIWHIYQNAAIHLSSIFASFPDFSKDFTSCIYNYEEEEEFMCAWHEMLTKYNLHENDWLGRMFKVKEKWALVYGRHTFCADMTTTQRSESMHSTLKKYVSYKHNLSQFFHHFDRLVDDRRYEELHADYRTSIGNPVLSFQVGLLKHARDVYTYPVFNLFTEELSKAHDSIILETIVESENIYQYKIKPPYIRYPHTVTYDALGVIVSCGCRKFEFAGILCCHALKVFTTHNIVTIPDLYIKKRWTKKAKKWVVEVSSSLPATSLSSQTMKEENEKMKIGKHYKELSRMFSQLTTRAAQTDETFEFLKGVARNAAQGLDEIFDNMAIGQPNHGTDDGVRRVFVSRVTQKRHETPEDTDDKSEEGTVVRGLKLKQAARVKSGKRIKSGLEQAIKKNKPKNKPKVPRSNEVPISSHMVSSQLLQPPLNHYPQYSNNTSMIELLQAQMMREQKFAFSSGSTSKGESLTSKSDDIHEL